MWKRIPDTAIDTQTRILLKDYETYYKRFPEDLSIDRDKFIPVFRAAHSNLNDDQRQALETLFSNALTGEITEADRSGVMDGILQLRTATELANLLTQWDEGELPNLPGKIGEVLDAYKKDAGIKTLDYLKDDIDDLLLQELDDSGLKWRLTCLNMSMRGLRPGDFGIMAGRPDRGKTTLVASELTHLAPQIPDNRPALWLNNEGPGNRIIPRLYQAALGATMSELVSMSQEKTLKPAYEELMGYLTRIRIVDVHGLDTYAVEGLIEKHRPGVVVFDMIDKIRGFGDAARTDLMLEQMYDWARELGVKHDLAGIATSQISNEGDGLQYPTLGMLKDSKTGKQGACDFQLMIGASNDAGFANQRFIGLPKNKLRREGMPSDPKTPVKYEPQRARYSDIPETPLEESE